MGDIMFKKILCSSFIFFLVGCGSINSGKISCSEKDVVLDYDSAILINVRDDYA